MSYLEAVNATRRFAAGERASGRFLFTRISAASLLLGLIVCSGACSKGDEGVPDEGSRTELPRTSGAIVDAQVTAYDFGVHSYGFDGLGGSLLPGDGWAQDEWWTEESFAWVAGTTATLWFGRLNADEPMEFRASCRALAYEGAPKQELTASVNGREVGTATIGSRWQDVQFDIPVESLKPGFNLVRLDLAWSRKPADVGLNNDRRDLSAAFRWIAVVEAPRGGDCPPGDRLTRFDQESGVLTFFPDASVAIPVPAQSRLTMRLEVPPGGRAPDLLTVNFENPDVGWQEIWQGSLDTGSDHEVVVENTDNRPHLVQISNVGRGNRRPCGEAATSLVWRPDVFRIEPIAEPPSGRMPHVFLYVVDTVRTDALALYGGTRPTSPALEKFSRDAVVYRNAITASTWTLPSVVSILTGVYPFRHGVMQGNVKLSSETPYPTLATLLSHAGFDTVGISQSFVVGPKFGVDIGFQRFLFNNQLNGRLLRTGRVRRSLTEWLLNEHDWGRSVFGYVHTVGPHAPYRPTGVFRQYADSVPGALPEAEYRPAKFVTNGYGNDPNEVAHLRALYDGEVQYADDEFGRFVEELRFFGLYDDSLVVFMSDHGEEFSEHGGFDHGRTVHQEVARVPLIVKYPLRKGAAGRVVDQRVSTVDVFATIAEAAGIDLGRLVVDGHHLPLEETEANATRETADRRLILSELDVVANEVYRAVNYRGLWAGSTKCIENLTGYDRFGEPEPQLQVFDLEADPGEMALLPGDDPLYDVCREWLAGWARIIEDGSREAGAGTRSSEETLEMLRSLGYIK